MIVSRYRVGALCRRWGAFAAAVLLHGSGPASAGPRIERHATHDRPPLNSRNGVTLPGARTTVNGLRRNSDPVVAVNRDGRLYDKRNGRFLNERDAAEARRRAGYYDDAPEVGRPVVAFGREVSYGYSHTWKNGVGSLTFRAGHVEASVAAEAGRSGAGVGFAARGGAGVTLVGVDLESRPVGFGGEGRPVRADGRARAGAAATADAALAGSAAVGLRGVRGNGDGEIFTGARANGSVTATIEVCGVSITATQWGQASAGLGLEAAGYFRVDFASMTVKLGGRYAVAFGVGGGSGTEAEIKLGKLIRDPAVLARCSWEALRGVAGKVDDLAKSGAGALSRGFSSLAGGLGGLFGGGGDGDLPGFLKFVDHRRQQTSSGSNVSRTAPTRAVDPRRGDRSPSAGVGAAAGIRR